MYIITSPLSSSCSALPSQFAPPIYRPPTLINLTQQLLLQNKLILLILFRTLVRAIVLPPDDLLALAAGDVAHDVAAGGHVALGGLALLHVDAGVEEVGFAVLAAEVLRQ